MSQVDDEDEYDDATTPSRAAAAALGSAGGLELTSSRTALKAALGVGYAGTAMPIMAQTAIKTSSEGLTAGEVTIEVNGFKMAAYRAAPAGKTNLPVSNIMEVRVLDPYFYS